MYRFFINERSFLGDVVKITGGNFNHISHSLRLKPGDEIIVCAGDGWDYLVELDDFTDEMVLGKVIKKMKNRNEPGIKVTLAQGIPKKNNMDLIVQKSTEIGVHRIIPLMTQRTIVKLEGKKMYERIERWQRIAEEAAKQSGRGIIPEVEEIHNLEDLAAISDNFDLILIPWEDENINDLKGILHNKTIEQVKNILIIIGPEGGFPKDEIEFIQQLGGYSLTLGPRILRTETAGIVALTMVLYEFGELGG